MKRRILIVGGAGFIGINSARYFIKKGYEVTIFDNFSRKGTTQNVRWLKGDFQDGFKVVKGDVVTDSGKLFREIEKTDLVLHLAAQVAVTTSITDPVHDFKVNLLGTLNVLEAVRKSKNKPPVIYSSTNKVYGSLCQYKVVEEKKRYSFQNKNLNQKGIAEDERLDFHSPYGCSKGGAAEYVLDYSRIFGLKTVVFHQSCIYGTYQFGVEDQGWVAWFIIAALLKRPVTIYGSGKQVRDLLYVDDLVRLYDLAFQKINKISGKAYNVGGGPANTLSLIELVENLENNYGPLNAKHSSERAGDQPIFIANVDSAAEDLGWRPTINVGQGLERLKKWIQSNQKTIEKYL